MKRLILLITVCISFLSCEKEGDILKGNFLYYADGAVLQTSNEVYGVIINSKMHELNDKVQVYKVADTDMVPVEVRAVIIPKPENEEGWPLRVDIKEIITITEPDPEDGEIIELGRPEKTIHQDSLKTN